MTIKLYKNAFTKFFIFTALAASVSVSASESSTTAIESTSTMSVEQAKPSTWQVEGMLQAHSVAGSASPWFGIGGSAHVLNSLQLGLRGFVPLEHTVDNSTYSLQAFARERLTQMRHTDFFLEGEYSENFYNFVPFNSYGLSVGVLNHVTPQISLGIAGGLEVAHAVIDSVGLETRSDMIFYPKVAFLANFGF